MNIIANQETKAIVGALSTAYPPYQNLDNTSLSKAPAQTAGSDFESLLKVQLQGPIGNEYNAVFFTNKTLKSVARNANNAAERAALKAAKRKAARAEQGIEDEENDDDDESGDEEEQSNFGSGNMMLRETYAIFADYLARTSGFVNAAFAQSRYIVQRASYLNSAITNADRAEEAEYHEAAVDYMLTALKKEEDISAAVTAFLNNLRVGGTHVILPSDKFKGGYDIVFSGLPPQGLDGKGTALSVRPGTADLYSIPRMRNFEHKAMVEVGGKYSLPAAQSAMRATRAMITRLFGASAATFETSSKRKVVQLPIDFDFKKLITDASSAVTGLGIDPRGLAAACPTFPSTFSPLFKKYFSIVAILEAAPTAVAERVRNENVMRENSEVSEESLHLMPTIGFSIAINMPEEIVNFITQTPKGGRVRLTSLNTWALVWAAAYMRKLNAKGGADGGGISISQVPKYVLSASSTGDLVEHRKSLGFYTEKGRTNDDHIYVANNGTLNYCPKAEDLTLDNARNYEALLEEALLTSYAAGSPLRIDATDSSSSVFSLNSPGYHDKIRGYKESIMKYAGSMQSFSWDYNCILTTTVGKADKLAAIKLSGATAPDELALSDYLRKPFAKAMQLMFVNGRVNNMGGPTVSPSSFDTSNGTGPLATSPFIHTFDLYEYLLQDKAVPDFQTLVTMAAKDMEITNLETDEKVNRYEWSTLPSRNLVAGLITADLKVAPNLAGEAPAIEQIKAIQQLLSRTLKDAAGGSTSNLARVAVLDGSTIEEDDHYFDGFVHNLHEFKNVYNYFGGRVFYHMLKAIVDLDKKKLMIVNPSNPISMVPYQYIVTEILPLATMLTKYVPNHENILARGDELAERNKRNDAITQDDIRVPGSKGPEGNKPGMQMFPHQIEGHKYLRNAPRFAVLDIAPGGGKTIEVLSDIACLVRDKLCSKPLIACPSNLVRNWVEDLHKITQGKWNVIPITTDSIKNWGFERLTEMIANAPRNTVCVVGYSALSKGNIFPIIIGNHVERVSGTLEFVKKFGFDYVAMDESHRVKNPMTSTHQTIKQLCTASNVKFVRLATGTLISNTLTDVVGQAAMFSSQIFRTPEEYKSENSDEFGNFLPDTPKRAREQLARHSAVITFKRKEWAFMLPLPQEEFIPVSMEKSPEEGGMAHQMAYDAVLTSVLDEIAQELKKKGSELNKLLKDEDDDVVEDDDAPKAGASRKRNETAEEQAKQLVGQFFDKNGIVKDQGQDENTIQELQRVLGPYIQRLEMLLTDPLGDEFGAKYFAGIARDNFVSNKVLKCIERIRLNFEARPWVKGQAYFKADPSRESDNDATMPDVCDFGGTRYVLIAKTDPANPRSYFDRYYSHVEPSKDTEHWKPEKHGKVIVFCRYIRSVNAIYDALQKQAPHLAKVAVKFHGDVKNKAKGLDAFKSTPIDISGGTGVQILIANEQSISEGHNLQMASRMIRMEAPWAPGELDQAAARIFRPDPKKDFDREVIYLDWILTDNSLEVAKMGRLISKMLTKAQFDEADNPLYDGLKDYQLPMKSMGIEALKEKETLADISAYTKAYGRLAQIIGTEFREMRRTKASTMFDIEPEPMFDDAQTMDFVPYVPNMTLPDRHGLGLQVMTEWLQDKANAEVKMVLEDPRANLDGKYVHTEMGNGKIKKVNFTRGDDRDISSVVVELDSGEEYVGDISMIHISPLLIPENVKKLPKARRLTKEQKEAMERKKKAAEKKSGEDEKKQRRRAVKELTEMEKLERQNTLKQRAKNPAKPTAKADKKAAPVVPETDDTIRLMPIMINGFLAIDAEVDDDDIILDDKHGFVMVKDYAYMQIKSYRQFDGLMDWLNDNFYIVPATKKRLTDLHDAFEDGKMGKFDVKQANLGDFKNFFQMYKRDLHTMAKTAKETKTRQPELKVYPTVVNGHLVLTIDLATNPIIKKYLGKALPGVVGSTWKHGADSSGNGNIFYRFAKSNSISELRAITKELVDEGFVWANEDEFNAEIADLKTNHGLKR